MDLAADDYFNSAANDEITLHQSADAYNNIKLVQRICVDTSSFEGCKTDILGTTIDSPICVTSTAFQRMAHP